MVRRTLTVMGVMGVLLILLFGRDVASYLTESADWVGETTVREQPIEFDLEQSQAKLNGITLEIRDNIFAIAQD